MKEFDFVRCNVSFFIFYYKCIFGGNVSLTTKTELYRQSLNLEFVPIGGFWDVSRSPDFIHSESAMGSITGLIIYSQILVGVSVLIHNALCTMSLKTSTALLAFSVVLLILTRSSM